MADRVGPARHLVVTNDGMIYVALDGNGAGVLALRDTNGDGTPDQHRLFARQGGSGVALGNGFLYFSTASTVYRYPIAQHQAGPSGAPVVIVKDLPTSGHSAHSLALTPDGRQLFVNIGSESNSCQRQNRAAESPGLDPCTELETRAGIWRFDANRPGQVERDGIRYATGIRNAVALAFDSATGHLYAVQHGRDQLGQSWPKLYTLQQSADLPAEELIEIDQGDDFGWPYCYYDGFLNHLVQAPEYSGDGKGVGRCGDKKNPLLAFPAHWAPNGLLFYHGRQFPERYAGGAFVAFHGSWNRAPFPQDGYRVVFVPFKAGKPGGQYEAFAEGFRTAQANHRPVGLAEGPDGSLYITDDADGRIWRVIYQGGHER
ncbi:MAG TPA: PQQ-dependent sugar dehydrogenase [Gemmatimonadales bacterium]|nr:PQQ-dependent sugar dehydrogenase [Gemmatimonadales bacterium]